MQRYLRRLPHRYSWYGELEPAHIPNLRIIGERGECHGARTSLRSGYAHDEPGPEPLVGCPTDHDGTEARCCRPDAPGDEAPVAEEDEGS